MSFIAARRFPAGTRRYTPAPPLPGPPAAPPASHGPTPPARRDAPPATGAWHSRPIGTILSEVSAGLCTLSGGCSQARGFQPCQRSWRSRYLMVYSSTTPSRNADAVWVSETANTDRQSIDDDIEKPSGKRDGKRDRPIEQAVNDDHPTEQEGLVRRRDSSSESCAHICAVSSR